MGRALNPDQFGGPVSVFGDLAQEAVDRFSDARQAHYYQDDDDYGIEIGLLDQAHGALDKISSVKP